MRTFTHLLSLALISLAAACGADTAGAPGLDATADSTAVDEGALDQDSILTFLNGPDATIATLIGDVRLQRRTALAIFFHVRGHDGVFGNSDDNQLDNLAELDGIRYVGAASIEAINAYVRSHYQHNDLTVEGVSLGADVALRMVDLANSVDISVLDNDVGLDSRAAAAIVRARPIADINALANVSYIGKTALTKLRDYAITHPATTTPGPRMPPKQTPIPWVLEWTNDYRVATGYVTRLSLKRDGTYDATVNGVTESGEFFGPASLPTTGELNPMALQLISSAGTQWVATLTLYTSTSAVTERDGHADTLKATLPTDGEDMCGSGGGSYLDDDSNGDGLFCQCPDAMSWIPALGGCVQ